MKIMLAYLVNIKGHGASHQAKAILKDCWKHESTNVNSFGWIGNVVAEQAGLDQIKFIETVPVSNIPPWLFAMPMVNFEIKNQLKKIKKQGIDASVAPKYLEENRTEW